VAEEIAVTARRRVPAAESGPRAAIADLQHQRQVLALAGGFRHRLRKPDKGDFTISKLAEVRLYFIEPRCAGGGAGGVRLSRRSRSDSRNAVSQSERIAAACALRHRQRPRHPRLIRSHRAVGILPEYSCADLLADRALRATLLPRRRDVWLLVQNHLKRDPAARAVIGWMRDCFQDFARTALRPMLRLVNYAVTAKTQRVTD